MLTKVKERVKAWKRLYTQGCKNLDENSSWHEILMELEYYRFSTFYPTGQQKLRVAIENIGTFSKKELKFLETLPAYTSLKNYLKYENFRDNFVDKIDGADVFSTCSAQDDEFPVREYMVVTDRQDLWGLEIYIFKDSINYKCGRHGIIRYIKEPPADFVNDLPF